MADSGTVDPALLEKIFMLIRPGQTYKELMSGYDSWATAYDNDMSCLDYQGPGVAADFVNTYCSKLGLGTDARVIDIAAGTGLVGKLLADKFTFTNMDALDGSEGMLQVANQLGVYKNTIHAMIGGHKSIPTDNDTYDVAVICGALVKGHLDHTCLPEIMRIVKPGGVIIDVTRAEYLKAGGALENMTEACDNWERDGKWKKLEVATSTELTVSLGHAAIVHVYQVL